MRGRSPHRVLVVIVNACALVGDEAVVTEVMVRTIAQSAHVEIARRRRVAGGKIARSSTIHHRTDAQRVMTSCMRFVALAVLAIGCVRAAPASFSAGDRWTFSLVDPLDD